MKLTLLLSFIIFNLTLSSQCTITGQTYGKLIHAQNGVDTTIDGHSVTAVYVWAGQSFDEVFQLKVPADTSIDYNGTTTNASITNMVLNNVSNLPNGASHNCNPANCTFSGNTTGCVSISGIISTANTGTYKLDLNITANVVISGIVPYAYQINDSSFVLIVRQSLTPPPPLTVQERLDTGATPLVIYNSDNALIDSLYGKSYAGGLIFYFDTISGAGLLAANNDQSSGIEWGCHGTQLIGAEESAIGTGALNSSDIAIGCSSSAIAARLCNNLILNNHDDWFLPSKDELELIYTRLYASGIDSFSSGYYWSSTEANNNFAWVHDFSNGSQTTKGKTLALSVRACRYFDLPTASISQSDTTICNGDSIMLSVSSNANTPSIDSLSWSSGQSVTNITLSPSISQAYYVSIHNGWAGTTDSIHINVEAITADFGADNTISNCPPLIVNFSDSSLGNIVSWDWNLGDGTTSTLSAPSHTYGSAGTYDVSLTVINSLGCSNQMIKSAYIQLTNDTLADPNTIIGLDSVCNNDTLTYSTDVVIGAVSYNWTITGDYSIIGGFHGDSITIVWGANPTGEICVNASDSCDTTANICMNIYEYCLTTKISEEKLSERPKLFPNPNTGSFTLELPHGEPFELRVYSLLGRELYNEIINKTVSDINIPSLQKGAYIIELKSNKITFEQKLIIN